MSMQHFIVYGLYDDELQSTCDWVLAETEDDANKDVEKVREATCTSGRWQHDYTTTPIIELEHVVKALKATPQEVMDCWEGVKYELGYKECKRCGKPVSGDPEADEENLLCGACVAETAKQNVNVD